MTLFMLSSGLISNDVDRGCPHLIFRRILWAVESDHIF